MRQCKHLTDGAVRGCLLRTPLQPGTEIGHKSTEFLLQLWACEIDACAPWRHLEASALELFLHAPGIRDARLQAVPSGLMVAVSYNYCVTVQLRGM